MERVNVVHKKIKMEGLKESYRFLHITDTHLVCFGQGETRERAEYVRPRQRAFSKDGILSQEWMQRLLEYANEQQVSAVLFTGDIIDFPSPENLLALKNALETLTVPYIYVPGNHDWSYFDNYHTEDSVLQERPLLRPFCQGSEDFHTLSVGEVTFVALDNSMDRYRPGTESRLKEALEDKDCVIALQHVPFYCDTLHEDTVRVWKLDVNLGGKGIVRDESADRICRLLVDSPAVRAVFCGHLHFDHEDLVEGVLPQYVTTLGCGGDAVLFEISG